MFAFTYFRELPQQTCDSLLTQQTCGANKSVCCFLWLKHLEAATESLFNILRNNNVVLWKPIYLKITNHGQMPPKWRFFNGYNKCSQDWAKQNSFIFLKIYTSFKHCGSICSCLCSMLGGRHVRSLSFVLSSSFLLWQLQFYRSRSRSVFAVNSTKRALAVAVAITWPGPSSSSSSFQHKLPPMRSATAAAAAISSSIFKTRRNSREKQMSSSGRF